MILMTRIAVVFFSLLALLFTPSALYAATSADGLQASMDAVWVITAGALVFFMQAGFAFVESGMTRSKNAINVIMKNYTDVCFGSLVFWMIGYGLMFGVNTSGWFGSDHFFLMGFIQRVRSQRFQGRE